MRGADVFEDLRRAASAARSDANAAEAAAARVRDHADALGRERLQTLRELAATQLPELTAATAGAAMPELALELAQFERLRQARSADLAAKLASAQQAMHERSNQLAAMATDLDRVVAQRDDLLAAAAKQLATDASYPALSTDATQAEVCLARDIARAEELRAEAKLKLPPYDKSRLFGYLWDRKFGTTEYRSRGFTARMDRRLAEFIGFGAAAASYRFLKATPEIVRLAVERRTSEVAGLRQRLEEMEDAVEAALGVPAVQAELDRRVDEREALMATTAGLQQEIAGLHAAMRDEVGSRGTFHAQALQRLTGFLAQAESAALERHARMTPDAKDDQLVAALRLCTGELARVAAEAGPLEQDAYRRDAIADGLEDLLVRFRREDYDAGRSEFFDLDLDRLLREARTGGLPAGDLWQALRSRQRFAAPPVVHHAQRTNNVLNGVGLALQVVGVLANVALSSGRRSGGFSIGGGSSGSRSSGGSRGGGFSTGRTIGGGGGFTTGERF